MQLYEWSSAKTEGSAPVHRLPATSESYSVGHCLGRHDFDSRVSAASSNILDNVIIGAKAAFVDDRRIDCPSVDWVIFAAALSESVMGFPSRIRFRSTLRGCPYEPGIIPTPAQSQK